MGIAIPHQNSVEAGAVGQVYVGQQPVVAVPQLPVKSQEYGLVEQMVPGECARLLAYSPGSLSGLMISGGIGGGLQCPQGS